MTQHEIKNRWTDEVLFTCDIPEGMESGMIARHAVETAIAQGANLRGANLEGANLEGANLRDANLEGANLRGANLEGANLEGANLRDANLEGANLRDANLEGANLRGANLEGANLQDANLEDANLEDANLEGANLRDAKNVPLVINSLHWMVYISGTGMMRIGCQEHSIERWKGFSDELISRMDSYALEFWNQHKAMLLGICDTYKHAEEAEKQEV
ncbi:pentapeptide repeat-containing protein [Acinetobacter bouvetii]|uniref:Pentapeptide repeat-containing protein n=1 Tax=Acinetobacter bouvetii TaxID=202951 RepID=A0A4V2DNP5_9GAMM|nr:pentapeptide repeat-containing protein [Acinetobacter bouvetii]RZG63805.1 pentapeptide repeat-containing protein [Acinetobacter bouvetii]